MSTAADKFSRLAALRPTRSIPARAAAIRTPGEEDILGRILGAGIARNHYGEHLAIRNWFSTPEFAEPSSVALELLTKKPASRHGGQAEGGRYKRQVHDVRGALGNPEKWLFLDTETTGLAGGTGT